MTMNLTEAEYSYIKLIDEVFRKCSENKSLTIQEAERLVLESVVVSRLAGHGECVSQGYGVLQKIVSSIYDKDSEIQELKRSIELLKGVNRQLSDSVRGLADMMEDLYSSVPRVTITTPGRVSLDAYSIQNKLSAARSIHTG